MRRRGITTWCGVLTLLGFWPARGGAAATHRGTSPPVCHPIVIEGEVHRGQRFTRPFGHGLQIVLDPVPEGWVLRVWPVADARPAIDLASLATPPYHSINPLRLTTEFGFRSQDVIAWSPREFHYLPGMSGEASARRAVQALPPGQQPTPAQEAAILRVVQSAAEGRLTLLDAAFVPGSADASSAVQAIVSHRPPVPHTILQGAASPRGELEGLRFRLALSSTPGTPTVCRDADR